jgi:hypothetical protein
MQTHLEYRTLVQDELNALIQQNISGERPEKATLKTGPIANRSLAHRPENPQALKEDLLSFYQDTLNGL